MYKVKPRTFLLSRDNTKTVGPQIEGDCFVDYCLATPGGPKNKKHNLYLIRKKQQIQQQQQQQQQQVSNVQR